MTTADGTNMCNFLHHFEISRNDLVLFVLLDVHVTDGDSAVHQSHFIIHGSQHTKHRLSLK